MRRAALLAALAAALPGAAGTRFIIVSSPQNAKVSYVAIPEGGLEKVAEPSVLIDQGLRNPIGLAVDQRKRRLYVSDPDVQKIFAYTLDVDGPILHTEGEPDTIVHNVEARWVALDGTGNVYYSSESSGQILRTSAEKVLRGEQDSQVLYDATTAPAVSAPGGVAVDNFHAFWVNKQVGTTAGSVIRAAETPASQGATDSVTVLASNAMKAYGVCLALNNVYYTSGEKYLYGVKKTGGAVATITETLTSPRGCAWDGDGTVYVADKSAHAVYSFAGNMHTLAPVPFTKVADFEDASGLAVLSASARPAALLALAVAIAATAAGGASAVR